jgi:hypothetical protein
MEYSRVSTSSDAYPPDPPSSPPLRLHHASPLQQHRRLIYASAGTLAVVLLGLWATPGASFWGDGVATADYAGTTQNPPVVLAVEAPLREYRWEEAPHESLLQKIAALSPVRRRSSFPSSSPSYPCSTRPCALRHSSFLLFPTTDPATPAPLPAPLPVSSYLHN